MIVNYNNNSNIIIYIYNIESDTNHIYILLSIIYYYNLVVKSKMIIK